MDRALDPPQPPRPSRRVLADSVYDFVLGMLMDLAIEPGARVSIDGLARELDVSPTPVREALVRLEAEGLVVKRSLEGYTAVPLLDAKGFEDLFEMRLLLEPTAARLATTRASAQVLAELERSVVAMRQGIKPDNDERDRYEDYRAFAAHDARFHGLIAEQSGNRLLGDAIERLRSHRHLYRLYFKRGIAGTTPIEHEAILSALRSGDEEAAEASMRAHIEASRDRQAPGLGGGESGSKSTD